MEAKLSKNSKFVYLDEKPKKYIPNGIKVYMDSSENDTVEPIMTTDIKIGQKRYYLPDKFNKRIVKLEVNDPRLQNGESI